MRFIIILLIISSLVILASCIERKQHFDAVVTDNFIEVHSCQYDSAKQAFVISLTNNSELWNSYFGELEVYPSKGPDSLFISIMYQQMDIKDSCSIELPLRTGKIRSNKVGSFVQELKNDTLFGYLNKSLCCSSNWSKYFNVQGSDSAIIVSSICTNGVGYYRFLGDTLLPLPSAYDTLLVVPLLLEGHGDLFPQTEIRKLKLTKEQIMTCDW
ncbi:MAG: hypothetical protein JNM00_05555 [Flavobacteriales bacterium]|nr:hypothetical protein [Flavobacteriales bacterium]